MSLQLGGVLLEHGMFCASIVFLIGPGNWNFYPTDGLSIEELWRQVDDKLFGKICDNDHHAKLLPTKKTQVEIYVKKNIRFLHLAKMTEIS